VRVWRGVTPRCAQKRTIVVCASTRTRVHTYERVAVHGMKNEQICAQAAYANWTQVVGEDDMGRSGAGDHRALLTKTEARLQKQCATCNKVRRAQAAGPVPPAQSATSTTPVIICAPPLGHSAANSSAVLPVVTQASAGARTSQNAAQGPAIPRPCNKASTRHSACTQTAWLRLYAPTNTHSHAQRSTCTDAHMLTPANTCALAQTHARAHVSVHAHAPNIHHSQVLGK